MEMHAYAPLPGATPPILPSMSSGCQFAAALAFVTFPSALRGRLKVFAFNGDGGTAPMSWKRRATGEADTIAAWAKASPLADMGARCGVGTGLVVVQADTTDDLDSVQNALGTLPDDTIASVSRDGRIRLWMRIPNTGRTLPTRLDLAPGVRVLADGAYARLPPPGRWTTPPDDPDADYQALPVAWVAAILDRNPDPVPTVRYFH